MRKTILCLMVIMLPLALAACRATVEEQFCPTVTASTTAEEVLPESVSIVMFRNGESRDGYSVADDAQRQTVQNAIFHYLIKSAAWPGVDVGTLDKYIYIGEQYANGDIAEYYVFDKDGQHCMQNSRNGMYSTISDEVYQPLYELAMGWHTPHTMTVTSGGDSIFTVRNWIWSEEKDGLSADGMRLAPEDVANEIEFITLGEDFAPYVDGERRPDVVFKLYGEDFGEVTYPIPSGLAAWISIGQAGPGRYIAVAEQGFEDEKGNRNGYQYFFGLIIPEESE